MADTPSRKGTGQSRQTYTADGSTITFALLETVRGKAATLVNGVAALAADKDPVAGEIYTVEADGAVGIITLGEVGLPSGTGVVAGDWDGVTKMVGAVDGSGNKGYVRPADTTDADELANFRSIEVEDNDDATDVRMTLR
jgi:hypothetical protein